MDTCPETKTLCELVGQGLEETAQIGAAPRTVLVEFASAGFMAVAKWWVTEAADRSTEEVHRIYLDLMGPIVSGTK